jgi:hypothetical protein
MLAPLFAALLLQTAYQKPGAITKPAESSPPSGDTVGYWQQHVHYRIVARLDEAATRLHSRGELVYVNNSPDTLHEMYFHQYLNAFRPGSKWSAVDEREGRVRFQNLKDPDYGYERFTTPPTVDGAPVFIDYPGAPDSTVVHFRLPRPLAPRDSVHVAFEWDARPSTVPRRQARRGRTWDFAQWYPKVAVYDRSGWEPNAFQPSGELYGEYGTYDVTMVVADDQVVVATGVPVAGDPGWERVKKAGELRLARDAYGSDTTIPPNVEVPSGSRAVRFLAENVHHFAWSASPDYRYEGGLLVRQLPHSHYKTWDTVSVHVLYKAGDDTTWGGGRALSRTLQALQWLESIWGPYAYPAFSNVHRIDGGGTEFPMMIMNGGASLGLILHEAGHNFTYGILGNNEWRSGWMDEGLTSYQTSWAQKLTPQERATQVLPPPRIPEGYRYNAATIPPSQSANLDLIALELEGRSEPIGTNAGDFTDFGIYNVMIYSRAELMYSHLRDALSDSTFRSFFHDYYDRWALKHVDEPAMRTSAERRYGHDLGWFFNEWVYQTGALDYALGDVRSTQRPDGQWSTKADIVRRGEYRHAMPVGARVGSNWTIVHGDPLQDHQSIEIVTPTKPEEVRIDPLHFTWDWDRRNDVQHAGGVLGIERPRSVFDWPFLNQNDREHSLVRWMPMLWYSEPFRPIDCPAVGCEGHRSAVTVGVRARSSYLASVDQYDLGLAVTAGDIRPTLSHFNAWARIDNPYLPTASRPWMGSGVDGGFLDGIALINLRHSWNLSPFTFVPGPQVNVTAHLTGAYPTDKFVLPEQWVDAQATELGGDVSVKLTADDEGSYQAFGGSLAAGLSRPRGGGEMAKGYVRGELSGMQVQYLESGKFAVVARLYAAGESRAPLQRAIFASTEDPFSTFWSNWYRPRGSIYKQDGLNIMPLGGAMLRGYSYNVALSRVGAANLELAQRMHTFGDRSSGTKSIWFSAFGDIAAASSDYVQFEGSMLLDAGVGASLRGRIFDRDVRFRLDLPLFIKQPQFAGGPSFARSGSLGFRYVFSLTDIW